MVALKVGQLYKRLDLVECIRFPQYDAIIYTTMAELQGYLPRDSDVVSFRYYTHIAIASVRLTFYTSNP